MSDYSFLNDEIKNNYEKSKKYVKSDKLFSYIEPSAEKYAQQFYAKNHIPSAYRPGNNSKPTKYNFINPEKYNILCYNG
tara:strand:- start:1431 stop:1667 length:237 start_codon:yes stop_codon:yes gene_type:complete